MALPLLIAGTALQMYGNYMANMNQATAEMENARFYEAQAEFVQQAKYRELDIAASEYTFKIGSQVSAAAKGGADVGSGSVFNTIANTHANKVAELVAIKRKADLDYTLAQGRASAASRNADFLSSPGYNLVQAGGTALTSYAAMKAAPMKAG